MIEFVKLERSRSISYMSKESSSVEMEILTCFLSGDIQCDPLPFLRWAYDELGLYCSGNTTELEKEGRYILLSNSYFEEEIPTELRMTQKQFIQLLKDWGEKVCKKKPKSVLIKYENDKYTVETSD